MSTFRLQIVTPDGLIYDGQAEKLMVRTTGGDICILPRHMNYLGPLGMGLAIIQANGKRRSAACMGGILNVHQGECRLVPTTFEWSQEIDVSRAEASLHRAEEVLNNPDASPADLKLAKARLQRALVRISAANYK